MSGWDMYKFIEKEYPGPKVCMNIQSLIVPLEYGEKAFPKGCRGTVALDNIWTTKVPLWHLCKP
jgi:hypothetical protein